MVLMGSSGRSALWDGSQQWPSWWFSCRAFQSLRDRFALVVLWPISPMQHGQSCEMPPSGISYAFSWTYAFFSSLSADQSWTSRALSWASRNQAGWWATFMASEYGYKDSMHHWSARLIAPLGPNGEYE
jgi:hypothetical protein